MTERFVDLIRDTTEREVILPSGMSTLWCPLDVGTKLRLTIARRGEDLSGLVMQAMRFVRLASLSAPGGLVEFLYLNKRLPMLSARHFKTSIQAAMSEPGLKESAVVTASGVQFLEPEMNSSEGSVYTLGFAQMPLLAAFVDFAYLALSPDTFNQLCDAITCKKPRSSAITVGLAFKAALLNWLRPRMEKEHFERQSGVIRNFLETREIAAPEDINNQVILDFWRDASLTATIDGFRRFRNASSKMLAYRRALHIASTEFNLDRAASFGVQQEDGKDPLIFDPEREEVSALVADVWTSPLVVLGAAPLDAIKWWKSQDQVTLLSQLLPDVATDDDSISAAPDGDARCLFGIDAPHSAFFSTLIRFTCFGKVQNGIAAGNAEEEMEGYDALYQQCVAVEEEVKKTIAHVGRLLMERGAPSGFVAALALFPGLEAHLPDMGDEEEHDMSVAKILSQPMDQLLAIARLQSGETLQSAMPAKIRRHGLTPDHWDQYPVEIYESGLMALVEVHGHLRKYLDWMEARDLAALFEGDLPIFKQQFGLLYEAAG